MWLNSLKIALLEQDTKRLDFLMDNLPHLEKEKDITTAIYLLKEATSLMERLKDETQSSMVHIQKNINFLQSIQSPLKRSFDITS